MQEDTTHVQMACCMAGMHASRHTTPYMSISMHLLHARRHLVLRHVKLYVLLPCTATPLASEDTQLVGWLPPRPDPLDQATSSFSVEPSLELFTLVDCSQRNSGGIVRDLEIKPPRASRSILPDFGLFGKFLTRDQSRIFFRSGSDEEYDEDYEDERATEYKAILDEEDTLLHHSSWKRNAPSIDIPGSPSIDISGSPSIDIHGSPSIDTQPHQRNRK
ncbi:hypothetical protein F2Q69_00022165 [Brassica cretica]|uniref:Uncharacterized protein n=1 Tax=Brassica cretica TaxID=69181 RepID=A0A8S9QDW3_BRACR|nr:hypothetical protein F2Q69_00022165 [Brassica cretica]